MRTRSTLILITAMTLIGVLAAGGSADASDWPQFMRGPERTGDAADEVLQLPLGLVAQVKLDDAVMTSPAVVGGLAYVVDQMGTAYCVDPKTGKVIWKVSPDGEKAMGANSSSPCVVKGRVYYGTTAGTFHVLDAKDGKVVRTVSLGWPVVASPAAANESIYILTVGAILHCFNLDGNERWKWDHYARNVKPDTTRADSLGSLDVTHHAGARELCASGKKVIAACGWDFFCLEDEGKDARVLWYHRAPIGQNKGVPMSMTISGDYVYATCPGVDGSQSIVPFALKDGRFHAMGTADEWKSPDMLDDRFAVFGPLAVRGATVFYGRSLCGFGCAKFHGTGKGWHGGWISHVWSNPASFTPSLASPALSREHAAFVTVQGELVVTPQAELAPAPFRFKTPQEKMIASSPAISGGCIYFGCDDGFLYVLGPGGTLAPKTADIKLHEPKSKVVSATGNKYAWPCPAADPANTGAVADPALKPPFRVRWAIKSLGSLTAPATTGLEDVFLVTQEGDITAIEQSTGRIRWRRCMPNGVGSAWPVAAGAAAVSGDRLYLVGSRREKPPDSHGILLCLDTRTGRTIWEQPVGRPGLITRWSPILTEGLVVTAGFEGKEDITVIRAFDAEKGTEVWKTCPEEGVSAQDENSLGVRKYGIGGCLLDGRLFYTWAFKGNGGATAALDPRTGTALWKTTERYGQSGHVAGKEGRLYIGGYSDPPQCLLAKDGSLIWKASQRFSLRRAPTLGKDCVILRSYGGSGAVLSMTDGKPLIRNGKTLTVGGPAHSCGQVTVVLPNLAFGITAAGLRVHNLDTGELLWQSRGFTPRTCSPPTAANGRIFVNPQIDGAFYCFEPGNEPVFSTTRSSETKGKGSTGENGK
ncbi:MAG: PQQ-binding-like beta-propeller repeat protein [Planctomycetota bacterium]